jgi:hypothetical protein
LIACITCYDEAGKRAFSYWTDADGQVLKRQELVGGTYQAASGRMNGASKSREHSYYYLDGHRIGDVGNDQTERTDYAQELARLGSSDTRRSYERFTPSNAADFDANYQPINNDYPAATPSAYTVRAGDTLHSIARTMWGDASLWYLLAEANGLIGTQPGTLLIPNQVANIHNTSATFKPYNPGKALGDTMPTLPAAPPPQQPSGGGSFEPLLILKRERRFTASGYRHNRKVNNQILKDSFCLTRAAATLSMFFWNPVGGICIVSGMSGFT